MSKQLEETNCVDKEDTLKKDKSSKSRRETAVQGTNDCSIVSKCSMSQQGYYEDPYLQAFVVRVTRRAPLIHRGYYVRAKACEYTVERFLSTNTGPKQIISLGAGFDSSYFRLKAKNLLKETVLFEIDFPELVKRKHALIKQRTDMLEMIGPINIHHPAMSPHIELSGSHYKLLGVDLSQTNTVEAVLRLCGADLDTPTLLMSECVLTYMTRRCSSALVKWASETFTNVAFVLYEQINPNDTFGLFMQNHYITIGSPLKCINHFPTLISQVERFIKLGWEKVRALDLNQFYSSVLESSERARVERLEMFDEYEELHLKGSHYFILTAHNGTCPPLLPGGDDAQEKTTLYEDCTSLSFPPLQNTSLRRFGHVTSCVTSPQGGACALTVGGFGEQEGRHMRVSEMVALDTASMETQTVFPDQDNKHVEVSRMHATVTRLQDGSLLLIGGRLSPMKLCSQIVTIETRHSVLPSCVQCGDVDTKQSDDTMIPSESCDNDVNLNLVSGSKNTDNCHGVIMTGQSNCDIDSNHDSGANNEVANVTQDRKFRLDAHCTVVPVAAGDVPCPRWRHSAVAVQYQGEEVVLIFGGRTQSYLGLNDCWLYSPRNNHWTQLSTKGAQLVLCHSHTASVWNRYMVVAGGLHDNTMPLNSVHLLDLETVTWSLLTNQIQGRYSHTAHVVGDFLVLIGGVGVSHTLPGVAIVHLPTGSTGEFTLPAMERDQLVMLHRHTSLPLEDNKFLILGGGGNCFSFGTHLNTTPVILDISKAWMVMKDRVQRCVNQNSLGHNPDVLPHVAGLPKDKK